MPLNLAQKSACRLHLGYPVAGLVRTSVAGGTLASGAIGYRFTQAYGFLEYKLNNLNPDEEARITGEAYGAVALLGPPPNTGDSVTVNLAGGNLASPQTITATLPPNPGLDGALWFVLQLAALVSLNQVCQTAQLKAIAPYGTGAYAQNATPFPEVGFTSPTDFTITASGIGVLAPQITAEGNALRDPFTSLDGVTTVYGYLPILNGLKSAFYSSSQQADTDRAGPWQARHSEMAHRASLYMRARADFSDFLGTPINPQLLNNWKRMGAMRYL